MKGNKIKTSFTFDENIPYVIGVLIAIAIYLTIRFIKKSALIPKNNQIIKKQDAKIATVVIDNKNQNPIQKPLI